MLNLFVKFFSSLRLTVVCLSLGMVLIFIGTMAQVYLGIHAAQAKYFQSLFIYYSFPGSSWRFPIFPGGHLLGAVVLVNLVAAHLTRFRLTWNKSGILLLHLGIFLLLLGGFLTDTLSVESQMRIHEGETKNYSESIDRAELVIIETSNPAFDQVVSIPDRVLARTKVIQHPQLPFRVNVLHYFPNSDLHQLKEDSAGEAASTQGVGRHISVTEVPPTTKSSEMDFATTVVEIVPVEGSMGTWLCSTTLTRREIFEYQGRTYEIQMRPKRYYKPYSIKLLKFSHDKYDGTEIPKNFSSKIHLMHSAKKEDREVLIYMNSPLRYEGETYYQAGFEKDNVTTVLQVIRNPSWVTPYLACLLVGLGLVIQFSIHLFGFARKIKA